MSLHLLRGLPFSSTGKPLKVRSKEVVYLQYSRVHRFADVKAIVLPDIRLHTNTVECVFAKESKPSLHGSGVSILDLNETAKSNSFKVLLALLVHEVASGDGPAFGDARERHRPRHREVEVVSGADGEVREEFHVADAVGSQLEVADWKTVFRLPPQGS